ncbi:MAG TPA: gluconate 2-dehydrogenase subunit 3 family protein [Bryobacteraceae bacterium]|nr:gluconate 2-dehydrogenase subunit 3 family protein [Bryobacteraceae bacterium]
MTYSARTVCDNVSAIMKPTRRVFLGASAAGPVLVTVIQPATQALPQDTQNALRTVMDLIIPAADGMPSASEAGGLTYLENLMQRSKDAATDIKKSLKVAEAFSGRSFKKPFSQLGKNDQIAVLKEMENTALGVFDALRAYVYESYYTQPAVWKLLGYELYPTEHMGPHLEPFDDSLVANVRKMPKLYREA